VRTLALWLADLALDSRSSTPEELLSPEAEQCGRQLMPFAEIRHRHEVDHVAPKEADIVYRRIVLAGLSHGETPTESALARAKRLSISG
jgi:hypothetical protein